MYERQKSICESQFDEIQKQNNQIALLQEESQKIDKEMSRLKKLNTKNEKLKEDEIKELKSKVEESYKIVDKFAQENEKLAEEKKVLEEIMNLPEMDDGSIEQEEVIAEVVIVPDNEDPNDDAVIEFYLQQTDTRPTEEVPDEIAEVMEVLDNGDPDDDEVIAFYLQQNLNRSTRKDPMSEASKRKQSSKAKTNKSTSFKCNICEFTAKSKIGVNLHKESQHRATPHTVKSCENCSFKYKSSIQLEKHVKVAHDTKGKNCWFWENGACKFGVNCRFRHPKVDLRDARRPTPCWYQENCRKPDCTFQHREESSENLQNHFLFNRNVLNSRNWRK